MLIRNLRFWCHFMNFFECEGELFSGFPDAVAGFLCIAVDAGGPGSVEVTLRGGEAAHYICVGLQAIHAGEDAAGIDKGGQILFEKTVYTACDLFG